MKTLTLEDKEVRTILMGLGVLDGQIVKHPEVLPVLRMAGDDHINHDHITQLAEKLQKTI